MDKTLTLKPRMSEKAYAQSTAANVYVFDVPHDANKHQVARAVAAQYEVVVTKVNVLNIEGKAKRTVRKGGRAIAGKQTGVRKAYVTLQKGQSLPIFAAIEKEMEQADAANAKAKKETK
jgi:large subunit ribosomal protein L23